MPKSIWKVLVGAFASCTLAVGTRAAESPAVFPDNQQPPVAVVTEGDKATAMKRQMDKLFALSFPEERKEAERTLIELLSSCDLSQSPPVGFATWSSPLNGLSAPHRRMVVALFHSGTGHYVDIWAIHESGDEVKSFLFEGSEKGVGHWQVVQDLNGDGAPEIIVKHFVGEYDGAWTTAVWTAMYRWTGKDYVRADEAFPDYYAKQVVAEYRKILAEHADWRDADSESRRGVYRKCELVLDRALAISKRLK